MAASAGATTATKAHAGPGAGAISLEAAIKGRHCVRDFSSAEVPAAALSRALDLAKLAPSAGNLQAFRVVLVRERAQKLALAAAALDQDFAAAPVVAVFLADEDASAQKYGTRGARLYAVQDATIAAAFFELTLVGEGLASSWVGAFEEAAVAEVVGASGTALRPVALLPLGFPDASVAPPHRGHRRKLSDFVSYNSV